MASLNVRKVRLTVWRTDLRGQDQSLRGQDQRLREQAQNYYNSSVQRMMKN